MKETPTDFALATADLQSLRQLLLDSFARFAYREGDFLLSSGQRSSYYINGKEVTLRPEGAFATGKLFLSMLSEDTEAVAGLTLGADPIVTAVSVVSAFENRPIPALIVRKEPKGHGTKAYIEGPTLPSNTKVAVLEDVVTTGRSAMVAVERLQAAGYRVEEIIALVDREQGGRELYLCAGFAFRALFSISEIQSRYHQLETNKAN